MAEKQKRVCKDCGCANPLKRTSCRVCHFEFTRDICNVCGEPIRLDAKYCNTCKSYQDVRQYLGNFSAIFLAVLTAALSAVPPALRAVIDYNNRNSRTTMVVKDADEHGVYVQFRNSGLAFSQIAKAQLIFDESVKLLPADLQQAEIGNTLIRPNEPLNVVFRLSAGLQRTGKLTDEEILQKIHDKPVKLRCVIAESDNPNHVLPEMELPELGARDLIRKGLLHA